jgi:hypothetical protein
MMIKTWEVELSGQLGVRGEFRKSMLNGEDRYCQKDIPKDSVVDFILRWLRILQSNGGIRRSFRENKKMASDEGA